jgi:MFS transporter, NNP family, nitrate/nitrite transporter
LSKQHFGTYFYGFLAFAILGVAVLVMMRVMQLRWTRTWAEKGGRARTTGAMSTAYGSQGSTQSAV